MQKVFVSHGDIILDKIYDKDLNLIKQDGGGCNWNDLYNLSFMGETCYAIGSVGNDEEGKLAIKSLKNVGIDTKNIKIENKDTNIMNIIMPEFGPVIHSWYSPITNTYTMNFSNNLPAELPSELQNKEIYVILDKFLPINLEFIKNISGNKKICLDLGHIRYIEHFTKQYLINFFKLADVIQLNKDVTKLLFERLEIRSETEFFMLLNLDLLIITKGKKGAVYLYKEENAVKIIEKAPKVIVEDKDTSGAGDAFFSVTLKEYAYTNLIDADFIENTFDKANSFSRKVISQVGSRIDNKKSI